MSKLRLEITQYKCFQSVIHCDFILAIALSNVNTQNPLQNYCKVLPLLSSIVSK